MSFIIDVSSNNVSAATGPPTTWNWAAAAAAGCVGVVVKATQGTNYTNEYYGQFVAAAAAAGIAAIAYHFAAFTDAAAEAAHFYGVAGALARVLDAETSTDTAWMDAFLAALPLPAGDELTYGSESTLPTGVRSLLWIAAYGPQPAEGEAMWQYTDAGTVAGLPGSFDMSEWLGTQAQFDAVFNLTAPDPIGGDVPAATDVMDTWVIPGGNPNTDYINLHADGSTYGYGTGANTGSFDYIACSNDGGRYHFGPTETPGFINYVAFVKANPGVAAGAPFPVRYFTRMVPIAYNGVPVPVPGPGPEGPTGATGPDGPEGPAGPEGPIGPAGPAADASTIYANLAAAIAAIH